LVFFDNKRKVFSKKLKELSFKDVEAFIMSQEVDHNRGQGFVVPFLQIMPKP
jgi:hypothetical protein